MDYLRISYVANTAFSQLHKPLEFSGVVRLESQKRIVVLSCEKLI